MDVSPNDATPFAAVSLSIGVAVDVSPNDATPFAAVSLSIGVAVDVSPNDATRSAAVSLSVGVAVDVSPNDATCFDVLSPSVAVAASPDDAFFIGVLLPLLGVAAGVSSVAAILSQIVSLPEGVARTTSPEAANVFGVVILLSGVLEGVPLALSNICARFFTLDLFLCSTGSPPRASGVLPAGLSSTEVPSSSALCRTEGAALGGVLKPLVCAAESCSVSGKGGEPVLSRKDISSISLALKSMLKSTSTGMAISVRVDSFKADTSPS